MFKLVIVAYMLALPANQPVGAPMQFENKARFATQDECLAYPKSGAGADQYNALMDALAKAVPEGHSITATTSCEKLADDGSI